jgi:hypothetical protein
METLLAQWAQFQERWARLQATLAATSPDRSPPLRELLDRLQGQWAPLQAQLGLLQEASAATSPETFKENYSEEAQALSRRLDAALTALRGL